MSDLGKTQSDYAVYLPAISSFYTKQLQKFLDNPDEYRTIEGFEKGLAGLDFLKDDSYFHYPYGLYSAGHAMLGDQCKSSWRQWVIITKLWALRANSI